MTIDIIREKSRDSNPITLMVYVLLTPSLMEYLRGNNIKVSVEKIPVKERGRAEWLTSRELQYHVVTIEYEGNIQVLLEEWALPVMPPFPAIQ
jgi:hypothetical protein